MINSTRRSVIQGAAWTIPVVTVAGAAPALAASTPKTSPLTFQFDGGGGANGYLNSTYLNLGTNNGTSITLSAPVIVSVSVIGLNTNTTTQRSFTPSSSDGTISTRTYTAATRTTTFTWTIPAGTVIPPIGSGTANPDILFSFGDGLAGLQRITNKIVVTGMTGYSVPPTLPIDSSVVKDVNQSAVSPDGIY